MNLLNALTIGSTLAIVAGGASENFNLVRGIKNLDAELVATELLRMGDFEFLVKAISPTLLLSGIRMAKKILEGKENITIG